MKPVIALLIALTALSHTVIAGEPTAIVENPAFVERLATRATIEQLRAGSYVLYMRHGNTDNTRPDRAPTVDLGDCSTQRPLNEEGRLVAASVGAAIRKAGIPVGEIFSSPLCRAKESALAAFGARFTINNLLMYTANMTDKEKAPIIQATRALISKPVQGKVNRVLVAHAPNLMDLIGYFPKEGTIVIFKPLDDQGFEYIGSITPQHWPAILP